MKHKFKKIDAVIIVALILIAGIVFFKAGYIPDPSKPETPKVYFDQDDVSNKLVVSYVAGDILWIDIEIYGSCDTSDLGKYVVKGNELIDCRGEINLIHKPTGENLGNWKFTEREELPVSLDIDRAVSPEDEGPHYNQLLVSREWWYYTVVFADNCDLPGWTLTVSFNHMSRTDLFFLKPDILFVTLNSPDGKKYGGIVEEDRPLGILRQPTLQATSSSKGFKVSFDESFATGKAPNWHVHVEGENIDDKHDIVIDLQFFAPSAPFWTYSSRLLDKSEGNIASYVFTGCEVTGTIKLDNLPFIVNGIGHHEHTWASGIISKALIRGWDWCHVTLENGWNIYYSNYYFLPQVQTTKIYKATPFAQLYITTDQGKSLTRLEDLTIEIAESDRLFLLVNMPIQTKISAVPKSSQILLSPYDINLDLNITADNTLEKTWKRFTYVGMKIGRTTVSGRITWSDEDGDHNIELNGIGTIWNMRH